MSLQLLISLWSMMIFVADQFDHLQGKYQILVEKVESELVVPDDQVGVVVVDLGQVGALVLVQVSAAPLNVSSSPHQRGHRPLHRLLLPPHTLLLLTAPHLLVMGQCPGSAGAARLGGHPGGLAVVGVRGTRGCS